MNAFLRGTFLPTEMTGCGGSDPASTIRGIDERAGDEQPRLHAPVARSDQKVTGTTGASRFSIRSGILGEAFCYVRHVNTTYRRTGTLWEGRFRAAPIESESHLLTCCRYIELNPVRAGMAAGPADYPWSSYRAHAEGAAAPVVTDHPMFAALGATAAECQAAYRALFQEVLDEAWIAELRAATNGGWAHGSEARSRRRSPPRPAVAPRRCPRAGHPTTTRPRMENN